MRAQHFGHGPGMAAPEAAESHRAAGAASALAAQAARSRDQKRPGKSATDAEADRAFLTLGAHSALKGYRLSRTHGDDGPVSFYVSRSNLSRKLRDLAAVIAFADQAGVGRG